MAKITGLQHYIAGSVISIISCVQGIASFIQLAKNSGVCIAESVTINRNADDQQFDDIVATLLSNEKARVSSIWNSIF